MTDAALADPDLRPFADTELGVEAARIAAGEPWHGTEIAGLQFYDYATTDELTEKPIMPAAGDRLSLVRQPENPHDPNAIEVWWRNSVRLGHLPRALARAICPAIDAGQACRAYVWNPGDGDAWSMQALLVGPAVESRHAQWIEHVVRCIERDAKWAERDASADARARGSRFERHLNDVRAARTAQAVATFRRAGLLGFEPDLPPVGSAISHWTISHRCHCSTTTAVRLAQKAGVEFPVKYRGYYSERQASLLTAELDRQLREWCRGGGTYGTRRKARKAYDAGAPS